MGVNVKSSIMIMIGLLIVMSMMVALAPSMFANLTNITGAPTWFGTVITVVIAAALVFIGLRMIK